MRGSYQIDELEQKQREVARLQRQAEAVADLETRLLGAAGLQGGMRCLELGSGPGFVTPLLARLAHPAPVISADFSHQLLTQGTGDRVAASAYQLPFADGQFDFIYARFLLQHLAQPEVAMAEVARLLAPGGRAALADSDDGLLLVDPPDAELAQLLSEAAEKQRGQGGDRRIGRRLPALLVGAELGLELHRVLCFSGHELGYGLLLELMTGFKAALVGRQQQAEGLRQRLLERAAAGRLHLSSGIVLAVGRK